MDITLVVPTGTPSGTNTSTHPSYTGTIHNPHVAPSPAESGCHVTTHPSVSLAVIGPPPGYQQYHAHLKGITVVPPIGTNTWFEAKISNEQLKQSTQQVIDSIPLPGKDPPLDVSKVTLYGENILTGGSIS